MEERLTDDTLTREQAMDVAREVGNTALDQGRQQAHHAAAMAGDTMERAKTMARDVGEQTRATAAEASAAAQDLARRARDQAAATSDKLYQRGMRAGEYLTENVNEYPLTALLIAGAIGYGIAFLIHTRWQTQG